MMTKTDLHLRRWIARSLLTVLLLAGLAGCGASIVYPRLDSLVGLYLRGLVSLDGSQSASLARTLEHNLEWHRSEELERYDAFLQGLASQVRAGVTRASLEDAAQQAEVYWRRIFEQAAPGYTSLAVTLSDRQVRELLAGLQQADEETWRDYSEKTPEERRSRREKSLRKNIERMTGPLSPQQRQLVRDYARTARPFMFEWRENRRLWREELAATLRVRSGPRAAFDERMRVLIAEPDRLWTPGYRNVIATSRSDFLDLLVQLDASLTPQQRVVTEDRLLTLAKEVRDLARRRG
ncbi:MAG: DUF6279 family lipoprotein [Steroidobacteraceae bacterium]